MTAFLIADIKVTDNKWVPDYAASVHDLVHKHGGKYLSRSGNVKTLEGAPLDTSLIAIMAFPSAKAAEYEAMKEIRVFSYLMHPPFLESHGVCKAIRQFVTGFADRSGLRVKLALNCKVDQVPFEMQRTLLRIAQEALANVHRHATASRVTLSLRWMAGCIHLVIVDDGKSGRASSGPGRGIRGMVARTQQYGGDLRVRSGATGTTVHAILPVNLA